MMADLPARCRAEEVLAITGDLAKRLAITGELPSIGALRSWRSKDFLTKEGRNFTRRNILEVLGITRLRREGISVGAAAERCRALDEERLQLFLGLDQVSPSATPSEFAEVTLQLLAKGILDQYRLVTLGAIVGHAERHGRSLGMPTSLRQACARLGRLYLEEGREDLAASIHLLLVRCMTPLHEWAPRSLASIPDSASVVLVDPDYRVPSEECEAIAQQAEGVRLDDLIENRLHSSLTQTLAKLGDDADYSYTTIREFIGRHPMATNRELHGLYARPDLTTPAVEFVRSLYTPVHEDHATGRLVGRCRYCRGLMGHDGRCTLQGCREDHPRSQSAEQIPLDEALIARPEVLKYWVDPAREELRLYDALKRAGIPAALYPHSDRCDVSIGDDVGVDVKDYREPVHLARRLNRGIGGLAHYRRSILAVADRRARIGDYIERLREQLLPELRQRVEVRSVSETARVLKRDFQERRGTHAREA